MGAEFHVNSYTPGHQHHPSVAAAADGSFVVAWSSNDQDGSDWGIFGQRFDSAGVPQGEEFQVNSYTTAQQEYPSVASDASGNFLVVWHGPQGNDYVNVWGQLYDSAGVPEGTNFRVNTFTPGSQHLPSTVAIGNNDFIAVWTSTKNHDGSRAGVFGRRIKGGVTQ